MVEAIAEVTLRTDEGDGVARDGGNNGDTVAPAFDIFLFILSLPNWSPLKWAIVRLSYLPDRVPPPANGRRRFVVPRSSNLCSLEIGKETC